LSDEVSQETQLCSRKASEDDTTVERPKGETNEKAAFLSSLTGLLGLDIYSMLSLPVSFIEPVTVLQRMAEIMEYTYLLDAAVAAPESEKALYVAAFLTSVYGAMDFLAWEGS
jgi:hypothetical protein